MMHATAARVNGLCKGNIVMLEQVVYIVEMDKYNTNWEVEGPLAKGYYTASDLNVQ